VAAIDARHDTSISSLWAAGPDLVARGSHRCAKPFRAAIAGSSRIVGSAAKLIAAAWAEDRAAAHNCRSAWRSDISWIARLAPAADEGHGSPKPLYLVPPMRSLRTRLACPADDRIPDPPARRREARFVRGDRRAMPLRSPHSTASRFIAAGATRIESLLLDRNVIADRAMVGRGLVGFILSRMISTSGNSIIAVAPARRRGLSHRLLDLHLAPSCSIGVHRVFLEVDEGNLPAVALCARRFRDVGRREAYYQDQKGPSAAALVLRRYCNQFVLKIARRRTMWRP